MNQKPAPKGEGLIDVQPYQMRHIIPHSQFPGPYQPKPFIFQGKKTNLFVNRIPFNFNEEKIKELFSKYGPVRSIKLKKPNIGLNEATALTTTATCLAYVDFEQEADALKAIEGLNG